MLMMIAQLLLLTCAYALRVAAEVPPYTNLDVSIQAAFHLLEENVLFFYKNLPRTKFLSMAFQTAQKQLATDVSRIGTSSGVRQYRRRNSGLFRDLKDLMQRSMDGNIPLLNDPRRQYGDIIFLVIEQACSFPPHDYYGDYQKINNGSLPFVDTHPETVIKLTNQLINEVQNRTKPIQELIHSVKSSGLADSLQIDKTIDEEIKKNGNKYDEANQIYLAAGLFATQLNKDDANYFAENAQNLTAHHFILTGVEELELIVTALHNLMDLLLPRNLFPQAQ